MNHGRWYPLFTVPLLPALLLYTLWSLPSHGDEPPPENNAAARAEYIPLTSVDDAEALPVTRDPDQPNLISIALDDVSLEDAVRMFTHISGANIIASAGTLEGRVTVNLQDVEWRPALRSILEMHNLSLVEKTPGSGVFSILPTPPDAPEPTQVITLFLKHVTVSEMERTVRAMLHPNAEMTVFPSRNTLVIRSTEANINEIRELVNDLDLPGRQVLIETRILELSDEARKAVGIDWNVLGGYEVGLTGMGRTFQNERTRTLESSERGLRYDYQAREDGSARYWDETGAVIPGADVESDTWGARPNIEGPVVGDRRWDEGTPARSREARRAWGEGHESRSDRLSKRAYSDVMTAVLSPADFTLVLSALQQTDGVSIVSNPKMLVTSGATNAFFSVGFREPIIEVERQRGTQESPGDIIISRLATGINTDFIRQGYLEEGVDLRVIATVKTDDHIEADIRPSLRRKIDEKRVGDNSWPILSVKEIDTTFTLRSGQTVAIGGLTEARDDKVTSRVPLLGDIPLLGRLFRHDRDVKRQTETIIFVTLSVADPDVLESDAGIPEDARLVHRHILRRDLGLDEEYRHRTKENLHAPVTR